MSEKTHILITNIILGIIKFIIIASFALAAFLDDYIEPLSKINQYKFFSIGPFLAIILDIIVNFIITKILKKKNKNIVFIKLLTISLVITIIETVIIIFS